jgi:hypothetical protein
MFRDTSDTSGHKLADQAHRTVRRIIRKNFKINDLF